MAELTPRRAGRPPRVSAAAILDAASTVPVAELTLTAVAAELKISVKTIYYYFPNRTELVRALAARAVVRLQPPDLSTCEDWREALRRVGHWTYRALGRLPEPGVDAGVQAVVLGRLMTPCLNLLGRAGFADRDAMAAVVLVAHYASGMATKAVAADGSDDLDDDDVRRLLRDLDDDDVVAGFARLVTERSIDEWFASGLEVAIAGVGTALGSDRRP